ncbi:hypothetical protein SAMN02745729_12245 [Marinobacterium iners DSM 11526]|uniref:Tetratricopeptide repeat-containing protein n=1 Tax=Marinobacterium iners DSM 11526 TaxID=1122198 RepID=A0A1H4H0A4_9GAMM|nr:hypothetical protein SAMN02745729_12245 [Marinobacterium iners DSM 11526]
MIFKSFRLSARFGKAHGLLLREQYDQSYNLLISILEAGPEDSMLPLVHEDLGIIEYHRGNFAASITHMDYCIRHSVECPSQWNSADDVDRLERISWYKKVCEGKHNENKT